MTDSMTEQVSALLDGETDLPHFRRVVDRLEQDAELRRRWEYYQLISDALHNNLPDALDRRFAVRVMGALEAESILKSPFLSWRPVFREAAGLAMVASLAAVTVLGVQWYRESGKLDRPPMEAINAQTPMRSASLERGPETHPEFNPGANSGSGVNANINDDRLKDYLIDHSTYAAATGMQGMMPYVRVVGYSSKSP